MITSVYLHEKNWIKVPENEIPDNIAESTQYSWFFATVDQKPAGVIRLTYDPSLEFPPEMGVTLNQNVNLKHMAAECKIVEIGRFMIRPEYHKNIRLALWLMRAAIKEVIERGYTHFLTDVFENDPHSPLHFHTKVIDRDLNLNLTAVNKKLFVDATTTQFSWGIRRNYRNFGFNNPFVLLTKGEITAELQASTNIMYLGDKQIKLNGLTYIINGVPYVPQQALDLLSATK